MKAFMVCVNYADFLKITLPHNLHHFEEIHVVTSLDDNETTLLCSDIPKVKLTRTNAFYENGATFNKWAGLEELLANQNHGKGREELWCVMDADILFPQHLEERWFPKDRLTTPLRRSYNGPVRLIPKENTWASQPLDVVNGHWSGYAHFFWTDDRRLFSIPWYDSVRYTNAAGADSAFMRRWPMSQRVRPPFTVLHLGESKRNWDGRVTEKFT